MAGYQITRWCEQVEKDFSTRVTSPDHMAALRRLVTMGYGFIAKVNSEGKHVASLLCGFNERGSLVLHEAGGELYKHRHEIADCVRHLAAQADAKTVICQADTALRAKWYARILGGKHEGHTCTVAYEV